MELLSQSTLSPNILFANFTEGLEQTNGKSGVATSHLDYIFGDSVAPALRKHPWDMLGAAIAKSVGLQLLLDQLSGIVVPTNERNGIRLTVALGRPSWFITPNARVSLVEMERKLLSLAYGRGPPVQNSERSPSS